MDLKLKDKVVLIIGATGDSGAAVAKAFAAEGSKLALTSTSQKKLDGLVPQIDIAPADLKTYVIDITMEDQVKACADSVAKDFGRIDVLVTCSGYLGVGQAIVDATYEEYEKNFSVNFFGVLWSLKHVAPYMIAQKSGAIILMSSNGAFVGAPPLCAYASSKHALNGLSKTAAMEFGPHGIHVNSLCPGGLDTQMLQKTVAAALPGKTFEEGKEIFSQLYLDNRLCTVEDVAYATLFLASEVSSHMMGDTLDLDGGMAANRK